MTMILMMIVLTSRTVFQSSDLFDLMILIVSKIEIIYCYH